ncbi:MAG: hypothetical protein U0793_24465 [Gemmataceae bacterium]
MPEPPDLKAILKKLADHQVEFILIGALSAVLQGAPISTFDVDIVHRRTPENLQRLVAALEDLDAYYRERRDRKVKPTLSHLAGPGHNLLATRLGPLDVLGAISDDRDYDSLLPDSHLVPIDEQNLRVLNLRTVIAMKEKAGRDKDIMALSVLKRTLEISEAQADQSSGPADSSLP